MSAIQSATIDQLFKESGSSPNGLTEVEAKKRLQIFGPNSLREQKKLSPFYKLIVQFKDLFTILLIFAAILAALSNLRQLSLVIIVVVFINVIMSLIQEARAEKAMQVLKAWVPYYSKVFREGNLKEIPASDIVYGDLIVVEEGDRIPADARLIEAYNLFVNNVPLTGESEPQPRTAKPLPLDEHYEIDVPNMIFMSTSVSRGYGRAVVTATGMKTKIGKIASLTQEIRDTQSPLQREIAYAAKYDFAIAMIIGFLFFLVGYFWLHLDLIVDVMFMIGVMIACVPEGLQVTVSSALAINVLKMVKQNILIRKLSSVQTLGSTTVICTDKTGTITKGEMTVSRIWLPDSVVDISGIGYEPLGDLTVNGELINRDQLMRLNPILEAGLLCNNATLLPPSDRSQIWKTVGDPTDGAFLTAALKSDLNIQRVRVGKPQVVILPFDSDRKMMAVVHKADSTLVAYVKGAPRSILDNSTRIMIKNSVKPLTKKWLKRIEKNIRYFGETGLRVVAIAYKPLKKGTELNSENIERDLIFLGLAALRDPPRPEVKDAVTSAKKAGIDVIMITGDYAETAKAIAKEVGIIENKDEVVLKGQDLQKMDDKKVLKELEKCTVIARASPEQKLRVVALLRKKGEVVAVTGDGANDAPSLRKADIGVSMGVAGTDVAKEASDMVLLDDSFASIVRAIEMGRTIYDNIKKFIVYVFSHNWAQLIPYLLYVILQIPLPLLVSQILAIDLAIDLLPSLALSMEPAEPGTMNRPPRSIGERLFDRKTLGRSLFIGVIIACGAMYGCFSAWMEGGWRLGQTLPSSNSIYLKGITMTFAGIVFAQMGNALNCRTNRTSLFKIGIRTNKWIFLGIISQLVILSVLIYTPFLQPIFGTTNLTVKDILFLIGISVAVFSAEEIRKFLAQRYVERKRSTRQ
ncbi:cation-translocating P-type ATPase [[Eubacterium] cellulosolvens]